MPLISRSYSTRGDACTIGAGLGARMKNAVIYIHGKGGNADGAYYYKKFFSDEYDVMGFDYKSELP